MAELVTLNQPPSGSAPFGSRRAASAASARTKIALACEDCQSRNYRTTRKPDRKGQLALKKFCPSCKKHTVHKETK